MIKHWKEKSPNVSGPSMQSLSSKVRNFLLHWKAFEKSSQNPEDDEFLTAMWKRQTKTRNLLMKFHVYATFFYPIGKLSNIGNFTVPWIHMLSY